MYVLSIERTFENCVPLIQITTFLSKRLVLNNGMVLNKALVRAVDTDHHEFLAPCALAADGPI